MTDSNLESILHENRSFPPPAEFAARARITPAEFAALNTEADRDNVAFWARLARQELSWHTRFKQTLDDTHAPNYRWFADGMLNASYNCLDVHLAANGDKPAIIFEGEPGDSHTLSYRQLTAEVCRFANALKALGMEPGDRIVIYMPMVPQAVIAMQACARIGATHSVVFGGFSANSLRDRIKDAGARMVITADGGWRGGKSVELKSAVDTALADGCKTVEKVIVFRRTGEPVTMQEGRDLWWSDVVKDQRDRCEPAWVGAEHSLFLLYTSGSAGKPKGIQHSTAGYLLSAKLTSQWVFDLHDEDIFWCTADPGWVTGMSYGIIAPLTHGLTNLVDERDFDADRWYRTLQDEAVTVWYTAPTALRMLMRAGAAAAEPYDLSSVRFVASVGEPLNPEVVLWARDELGLVVHDNWWQTETGGIMVANLAAADVKPGSMGRPLPGIDVAILARAEGDDGGPGVAVADGAPVEVTDPDVDGHLALRVGWPSMFRGYLDQPERYQRCFVGDWYLSGDLARRDADGYLWFVGRADDVIKSAGHLIGPFEVESALMEHPAVAEVGVIGVPDDVAGEIVKAFVALKPGHEADDVLERELMALARRRLGPAVAPRSIAFRDALPHTRSGKIMRRLLKARELGLPEGDLSTMETPEPDDAAGHDGRGGDAP